MATLDVYNFPYLKKMEVSAAIVRVSNYQDEATKAGLNDIQAGWVVSEQLTLIVYVNIWRMCSTINISYDIYISSQMLFSLHI